MLIWWYADMLIRTTAVLLHIFHGQVRDATVPLRPHLTLFVFRYNIVLFSLPQKHSWEQLEKRYSKATVRLQ